MTETWTSALVLGLGRSGMAAAELLLDEGVRVTALDETRSDAVAERVRVLRRRGARALTGPRAWTRARQGAHAFDACVVSPGFASDHPWLRAVAAQGVRVVSELELGARRCAWPMIAVTGSNGKSTAVKLCAEALALAGRRTVVAGNYGMPLCEAVCRGGRWDLALVEVSSFQLEHVDRFRPKIGVLLNMQPNHLDRHGTMDTYVELKEGLFSRMGRGDTAIVPEGEREEIRGRVCRRNANAAGIRWVGFGTGRSAACRIGRDGAIRVGGRRVALNGTVFGNPVLAETAAAVAAILDALGADARMAGAAARRFVTLPHRFETARALGGVRFVNDSKATSLSAMRGAIRRVDGPVRLIAGGRLKETDVDFVKETLACHVKKVYGIGENGKSLTSRWRSAVPCRYCRDLDRAVAWAWREARPGETVLFSPGCASFDQFANYAERGRAFVAAVERLARKAARPAGEINGHEAEKFHVKA